MPSSILRRDISRRSNPLSRVDKEEAEDLAVARPRRVRELEGRYAVLVDVGESDAPVLLRHHLADDLRADVIATCAGWSDGRIHYRANTYALIP